MGVPTNGIIWPDDVGPDLCPVHTHNERIINAPAATIWAWLIRAEWWSRWYPYWAQVYLTAAAGPDLKLGTGIAATTTLLGEELKLSPVETAAKKTGGQGNGAAEVKPWPIGFRLRRPAGVPAGLIPSVVDRVAIRIDMQVDRFEPFERLGWRGSSLGIKGYHGWFIEPRGDSCLVITDETHRGVPAKLLRSPLQRTVFSRHDIWLERLEEMCKKGHPDEVDWVPLSKPNP
jgi:hypothetical protein